MKLIIQQINGRSIYTTYSANSSEFLGFDDKTLKPPFFAQQ